MSPKIRIDETVDEDEYKTRKLHRQGGSIMASLPKKLITETAEELGITLGDLLKEYELAIDLVRDPGGSILNGDILLYFVKRGGGIKK